MRIDKPPKTGDPQIDNWLDLLWHRIHKDHFTGYATWNPGSIAVGAMEAKDVTVTGASLGDQALASFSLDVADLVLDAQVTATDTVTCVLANNTAGAVNLAEGTVYVRVFKFLT